MRKALPITFLLAGLIGTVSVFSSLSGCRNTGKALSGSTYCDPTVGSGLVPQDKVPSGSCKGTSSCIAFTAGEPCADPSLDAGECEWVCTCLESTWTCTASCSSTCSEATDGGSDAGGEAGDAGQ